ncbi:MAG: allantoinase AllB [Acidobacteriota bacterium]
MRFDVLITGGLVVSTREVRAASVGVIGGRVAAVLAPGEAADADVVVDARGLHILPGLIDTHVHTRHPGVAAREDMASGTAAAAAGGITTLLEMPIAKIPANSADGVRRRIAAMQPGARIDFALYGGAGHENIAAIQEQADAGVVAFKTFLQPPPPARLDEFFGLWCTDEATLPAVMAEVARTGLRHCFHCEDAALFTARQQELAAAGQRTGRAHARARPPIVEETSAAAVLALAADVGARVGIVHCSSARTAALAADARARGVDVTVETCPPYLLFTEEALDRLGPFAKCNPPLRDEPGREALWQAVQDGRIEYLGTDHSPFLGEEKSGAVDIFAAPPGLCGLDVFGPVMLTAVGEGRLALTDVVRLCSTRAASLFQLPSKGAIAVGKDADFVLVDLAARWRFDASRSFTKSRANMAIYDGLPLQGRIVSTWVRGARVYEEGQITGAEGHGRALRPGA